MKHLTAIITASLLMAGCATASLDSPTGSISSSPHQRVGVERVPPFGHIGFCMRNPSDCVEQTDRMSNRDFWSDLREVNAHVNATVYPVDDSDQYNRQEWWAYPTATGGDCEDYALEKQRMLVAKGMPLNRLLLATGKQADGSGHAVLIARMPSGDYVLDNQSSDIVLWNEGTSRTVRKRSKTAPYQIRSRTISSAPYKWDQRQSISDPSKWVNLNVSKQVGKPFTSVTPVQ